MSVGANTRQAVDLSSAVNLKSIEIYCGTPSYDIDWITVTVESIKSPHLKKMTLRMPRDITTRKSIETQLPGAVYTQWLDLDRALVKYLTPCPFKLKVEAPPGMNKDALEVCVERLLPSLFVKKLLELA